MTEPALVREQPLVLAADDDEDILELVAFRLERSGYTVLRAHDGEQALELARRERPDLAVLDVMMPKLDGFELTKRLRAEDGTSRMPIILLTARAQDADIVRGFLPDAKITFAKEGGREESGNYLVDWSRLAKEFGIEYPGLHTRVLQVINEVRQQEGLPLVGR